MTARKAELPKKGDCVYRAVIILTDGQGGETRLECGAEEIDELARKMEARVSQLDEYDFRLKSGRQGALR